MSSASAGGGAIRVSVVTPERAVLDAGADFVVLPLFDGEIGVGRGHSAFVGQLSPGEFRYRSGGTSHRYYIDGGFAQVRGDVVTVLTAKAVRAEDLSVAQASEARAAAEALPAAGFVEASARTRAVERAAAMSRVAAKGAV